MHTRLDAPSPQPSRAAANTPARYLVPLLPLQFGQPRGQVSAEWIAGGQFSETSQLLVGVHGWGVPGTIGGFKAAAELQHFNVADERLIESSTVSLAVTAPRFVDNKPTITPPSWSLSAFKRCAAHLHTPAPAPRATHASWLPMTRRAL